MFTFLALSTRSLERKRVKQATKVISCTKYNIMTPCRLQLTICHMLSFSSPDHQVHILPEVCPSYLFG